MSQSYPFLALARRHGADYGDVLLIADHLATGAGRPEGFYGLVPRYRDAFRRLTHLTTADILKVVHDEQQRRLSVTRL